MKINSPKLQRNHIGLESGLITWFGVVESRFDPLKLGRCKVRIFGWHDEDKTLMPTDDLPWSIPEKPLDNGRSVVGPMEGDWVRGYFIDGMVAQQPVMVAVVPGGREKEADPSKGFNDPRENLVNVPRDPLSFPVQHDDGTGSDLFEIGTKSRYPQNEAEDPLLRYVDNREVITNRLERNEKIDQSIVQIKKDNIEIGQTDIPTAHHPTSEVGSDHSSKGTEWTEPETPYSSVYPYNHAYWSESGHIMEIDDTPGAERLHTYHRSGTFKEIHPTGRVVQKIVDDEIKVNLKSQYEHIEAGHYETVDWNKKVFINKDKKAGYNYDITIGEGGDYNETIRQGMHNKWVMNGDENTRISNNRNYLIEENEYGEIRKDKYIVVDKDYNLHVYGYANIICHNNISLTALANVNINASNNINLNCTSDLNIKCGGNMTTYVAGNKWDVVMGDNYRVCMGTVYDMAVQEWWRIAATINDITLSGNSHNMWSQTINMVAPTVLINGKTPGTVSPVPPMVIPGLDTIFEEAVKYVTNKATSAITNALNQVADFQTLPSLEAELTDIVETILDKSLQPVAFLEAPIDMIWRPVTMEGVASLVVPKILSTAKAVECRLLDKVGNIIDSGTYIQNILGNDVYKFTKNGLTLAQNYANEIKVKVGKEIFTITEPAKRCIGSGTYSLSK